MRIGVVSDSHSNLYLLDKAVRMMGDIDMLIHLGDEYRDAVKVNEKYKYHLEYVAGNNDYKGNAEYDRTLILNGKRVLITHGHKHNIYYSLLGLQYRGEEENADIVLYGHTHIFNVEYSGDRLFLNPGSVSRPRDSKASAAILTIDNKGMVDVLKILPVY